MRLNLGCGDAKQSGWINVDKYPQFDPDQVVDLEKFPWPWPDNSVSEILLNHVLEHLCERRDDFLTLMCEMWRVCKQDAKIRIVVPHHRHDGFHSDPTHVRPITPLALACFSRVNNEIWRQSKVANTVLAIPLGIDFHIMGYVTKLDPHWQGKVDRGELNQEQVDFAIRNYYNVAKEIVIDLQANKNI